QAEDLALGAGLAAEDARSCLGDDLANTRDHLLELGLAALERGLRTIARRTLGAIEDFLGEALCLPYHPARGVDKIGIGFLQLAPALRALGSGGAVDLHDAVLHAAGAVAQLASDLARTFFVTFFMTRVSTRTPSPNRLLSVG